MATVLPSTQDHQIFTASIPTHLFPLFFRNKLYPLLPYSLPLYRRCQFYLYQLSLITNGDLPEGKPGQPELWVAVAFPAQSPPSDSQSWLDQWLNLPQPAATQNSSSAISINTNTQSTNHDSEQIWSANHIDLREPGQTQIWTFGSWEPRLTPAITTSSGSSTTGSIKITPTQTQVNLARALFHRLRTHHIPTLPRTPSHQYQTMKAAGKVVSSPYKRSKILFGTIAETSWWMLEDNIVAVTAKSQQGQQLSSQQQADILTTSSSSSTKNKAIARQDKPYLKYILEHSPTSTSLACSSTSTSPSAPAPRPFTPRPLEIQHLQTVLDRSAIPRTLELLRSLVTIGLFLNSPDPRPDPTAWGILSKDASISSLHTEPAFRGQGLAEIVVRELVRREEDTFRNGWTTTGGDDSVEVEVERTRVVPYSHTDVSEENLASRRVFEKMGARVGWKVGWVEVDVDFEGWDEGGDE